MQHLKAVNSHKAENASLLLGNQNSIVRICADGGNALCERSCVDRIPQLRHERSDLCDVRGTEASDSHKCTLTL